jgi:hypothetical protein
MQNDILRELDDAFKPQPTRVLIFDTGEAIYELNEYPTGWTIQRDGGRGLRIKLVENLTEEEMWSMLKLLK